MMTCPRCGANNDNGRAACWNCYAPLTGTLASRVKPMVLAGRGGALPAPVAQADDMGVPEPPAQKKRGMFGRK